MNKSGRIGAEWEQRCADYMAANGFPYAERRVTNGSKDRGDISGVPGVVVECKAEKLITLSEYMDEVRAEKFNAAVQIGFAVIKRRQHSVERAYAVMEFENMLKVIR